MARITIDGVWRETIAETRAHFAAFATLTAAFIFLPALLLGAALPRMPIPTTITPATMPPFHARVFVAILAIIALQSIGMLTIVAIAGDSARSPHETVGQTLARVLPGVLRYFGALLLLLVGYFIIAIPISIVLGVLFAGLGAAGMKANAAGANMAVGLALLVILPMLLWLGARLSPMAGVFSIEAASPMRGIRRAWTLSAGSGWRIMLVIVVFSLAVLAVLFVTQGLAAALGVAATLAGAHSVGAIVFVVVTSVLNALISILFMVALGVIYRQLRKGEAI